MGIIVMLNELQEAVNERAKHDSIAAAARALGIARETLRGRLNAAGRKGLTVSQSTLENMPDQSAARIIELEDKTRALEAELSCVHRDNITTKQVREEIFGLAGVDLKPPKWIEDKKMLGQFTLGIPTLFLTDWHWGEVVRAEQVHNYNEFNRKIQNERATMLIPKATLLLKGLYKSTKEIPGLVLLLGGDMLSGDIHEELSITNAQPLMPSLIDLHQVLTRTLAQLQKEFKRLWVICVIGNHPRNTHKPRHKDKVYSNFDWLLYQLLEKSFRNDNYTNDDVQFLIPSGGDAPFRIYDHFYLLTHGNEIGARSGDGIIGAIGPIMRGEYKMKTLYADMDYDYDTLVMGHWHQKLPLDKVIVGPSLIGYNEYAMDMRLRPAPAGQLVWFTHPEYGIIRIDPIYFSEKKVKAGGPLVSWVDLKGA